MVQGCVFSYSSKIFIMLMVSVLNPILLDKPGAEGKKHGFLDWHAKVCVHVCMFVYIYMYIHVCMSIKR